MSKNGKVAVYAGVGAEFVQYDPDVEAATLTKRGSVRLPAQVQYAWPHVSREFLYVTSSDAGVGREGYCHHVAAFRIDPVSGALTPHGEPIPLPLRMIHMTTDISSEHVLIAYNDPSGIGVFKIRPEGGLGAPVDQPASLDYGIFAHQVRVMPSNKTVILVARGNDAKRDKPEDPGALKLFDYRDGVLTNRCSVAPGGGYGFGPRHIDFHPAKPWLFVSLERQNRLCVFKMTEDGCSAEPLFSKATLAEPGKSPVKQMTGTIHVHPNGRFVYLTNRSYQKTEFEGKSVVAPGENTVAVFAIDQDTGEPTLIQNIDSRGIYARTFAIDPSGRMMVVAHVQPFVVYDGKTCHDVPACLSVFRVGVDGKLEYARKYDIDVGNERLFWMGMVDRP
jgi:6-phosphogluconolactonase